MRALILDFRRPSPTSWAGVALLVAGIGGAALLGVQYRQMLDEQAQAEHGMRKVTAAARKMVMVSGDAREARLVDVEIKRARRLLLQMNMPWEEMFASVEKVDMRQVGLLSVETDIDKQVVKIDAEAKDIRAMLRYLGEMERRATFADVYLQSHRVQLQDAQRPVRFVLTAKWRTSR